MAYVGDRYEVQVSTGIATSYYAFGGQRVAMWQGNKAYWLHGDINDHILGMLTNVTDRRLCFRAAHQEHRHRRVGEKFRRQAALPTRIHGIASVGSHHHQVNPSRLNRLHQLGVGVTA